MCASRIKEQHCENIMNRNHTLDQVVTSCILGIDCPQLCLTCIVLLRAIPFEMTCFTITKTLIGCPVTLISMPPRAPIADRIIPLLLLRLLLLVLIILPPTDIVAMLLLLLLGFLCSSFFRSGFDWLFTGLSFFGFFNQSCHLQWAKLDITNLLC